MRVAHGDGSFARRLAQLAKLDLLVVDDFAISPMGPAERNDLLELLDERIGTRPTLITSQLPIKACHTYLNDPTLADVILDRVVHSSHKIELKGIDRACVHARSGAPPAAWQGPRFRNQINPKTSPITHATGERFRLIVDD